MLKGLICYVMVVSLEVKGVLQSYKSHKSGRNIDNVIQRWTD